MSNVKLAAKLSKFLPAGAMTAKSAWSTRIFVTASPRPLQAKKDKDTEETCEKVKEAAEAVKEGAKGVKQTTEVIKDAAASTAESVTKMTKVVTEKISETITDKAKDKVTDIIKNMKN